MAGTAGSGIRVQRRLTSMGNHIGAWLYRASDGRLSGSGRDSHVLMISAPGRVTGVRRSTCVRFVRTPQGLLVWGTASGARQDPDWFRNLRATPLALVQVGAERMLVTPRELTGDERDTVWRDAILQQVPGVRRYASKAGRTIPVAVLTPLRRPVARAPRSHEAGTPPSFPAAAAGPSDNAAPAASDPVAAAPQLLESTMPPSNESVTSPQQSENATPAVSEPRRPNLVDYEETRGSFRLEPPQRFNPVLDILERWAQERPDDLALLSVDGTGAEVARQSVADLCRESRRAARALMELGVGKGDRVFVMLPRRPAWYAAALGAIRIGAVPMPGTGMLTPKDIGFRVTSAGPVAAITNEDGAAKLDAAGDLPSLRTRICVSTQAPPPGWTSFEDACRAAGDGDTPQDPTAADDPMLIYFTSGTVANPKMVLHTQASYGLGHVITARFWQDLHPGDLHWTVSDTGWAKAAWGALFGQWHERAAVMQVDLGKPDPDTILRILSEYRVNSFCAPPTLYRMLVQADLHAYDLPALRHCTSAGEPLNPEVIRAWAAGTGGLMVYDGYGQTETTNLVANFPGMPVKPGSMGRPTPGYVVDVLDDAGKPVAAGTVGNVTVLAEPRPAGLFTEYLGDPDATRAAFRGGWYYTGDKAARDSDGYFWFEGRSDDVITSAAYRIGPFEVESALIEHPAVAEAAVVGKPDETRTEIVTAFCILAPGHEPSPELAAELQEHVKTVTAPYKYPREIYFVAELPKTISGKIRRSQLRQRLQAGLTGPAED